MTAMAGIETIERLAHRNALALRFRDVHLDQPVTDGLTVQAVVAHSDRTFPAVRTPSGAYTVRSLPGLGSWQTRAVDATGVEDLVVVTRSRSPWRSATSSDGFCRASSPQNCRGTACSASMSALRRPACSRCHRHRGVTPTIAANWHAGPRQDVIPCTFSLN
jgi:hypothetical protein